MARISDEGANLRPVVPEGTRLAWSRENGDRRRALLFDKKTNKLLGPAELVETEDEDFDYSHDDDPDGWDSESRPLTPEERAAIEAVAQVAAIILIEITKAAVHAINTKVIPRVRAWWSRTASPAIKRAWDKRPGVRRDTQVPLTPSQLQIEAAKLGVDSEVRPEELAHQLGIALNDYKRGISAIEAQDREFAIAMAEAFIAEQRRVLAESVVVEDYFDNLTEAVEHLSEREIPPGVSLMIESAEVQHEVVEGILLPREQSRRRDNGQV